MTAAPFDTKVAVVLREGLPVWQGLNVTAFLATGIAGAHPELIGEPYRDASDVTYLPLLVQPVLVFQAQADQLATVLARARTREVACAVYTEDMFATGHDAANRATVRARPTEALPLVGLALRAERKLADKLLKGLRLHP